MQWVSIICTEQIFPKLLHECDHNQHFVNEGRKENETYIFLSIQTIKMC